MNAMATGPAPRLRWLCTEEIGPFRWWMMRPWCWVHGHRPRGADVYSDLCMVCGKLLWSRPRVVSP